MAFLRSPKDHLEKKTAHAAEQNRPDVLKKREAWFDAQPDLDPERLVFIDETSASTKMARLYGRVQRGQRCRAAVPHGHWKTTTVTASLRLAGIAAPMVLDGPMNGQTFKACVEQSLVPELAPGDIVVMDNLPAHKVTGIRETGSYKLGKKDAVLYDQAMLTPDTLDRNDSLVQEAIELARA